MILHARCSAASFKSHCKLAWHEQRGRKISWSFYSKDYSSQPTSICSPDSLRLLAQGPIYYVHQKTLIFWVYLLKRFLLQLQHMSAIHFSYEPASLPTRFDARQVLVVVHYCAIFLCCLGGKISSSLAIIQGKSLIMVIITINIKIWPHCQLDNTRKKHATEASSKTLIIITMITARVVKKYSSEMAWADVHK